MQMFLQQLTTLKKFSYTRLFGERDLDNSVFQVLSYNWTKSFKSWELLLLDPSLF